MQVLSGAIVVDRTSCYASPTHYYHHSHTWLNNWSYQPLYYPIQQVLEVCFVAVPGKTKCIVYRQSNIP